MSWAMCSGWQKRMCMQLNKVHHIAIICSDFERSKKFYTKVLGLTIVREIYREERSSYKLDLALNGEYIIELFSFPLPPARASRPEATGLRHLAFEVDDLMNSIEELEHNGVTIEPIRIDEFTGKRFTFIADPDGLPIEFYER
jgi:glyoxylase I family protein